MSAHTPGPWSIVPAQRGFVITAKDGQYDIAVVRNIGNDDNEANAALIAAAPQLLADRKELVEALDWLLATRNAFEPQQVLPLIESGIWPGETGARVEATERARSILSRLQSKEQSNG